MAPKKTRKRANSKPGGPTNYIETMQYCDNITFNAGSKPLTAKRQKVSTVSATPKQPPRPRRNASAQSSYSSPNSTQASCGKLRYVTPEDFLCNTGGMSALGGGTSQLSDLLTTQVTRPQDAVMAWDEDVDDALPQEFVSALEQISSFITPPASPKTSSSDITISSNEPGPSK